MERVWLARLPLGIIVGNIYVCGSPGSRVEIKHFSVAYFDHITALQVLKCRTLVKGVACTYCVNVVRNHEFTHCVCALRRVVGVYTAFTGQF